MLEDENCRYFTIPSIAKEVGFNALSNFNKASRKVYKTTLSQFNKLENCKS